MKKSRQKPHLLKENSWKPMKKTGRTPLNNGEQLKTDEGKQAEIPMNEGKQLETEEGNIHQPH